ncbi:MULTISPECIES: hypothetical protein [unclassified Moraxella]|uniref:hypothetical protein n=1 Tax=unclassified Moraxella TaxID=2685852 RepID=UPI00359D10B6
MKKSTKPTLKLGVVLIGALMLSACQSTPSTQPSSLAKTNWAYSQMHGNALELFSDEQSPATISKNKLTNALKNHLQSDRFALSTIHSRAMPMVGKDSVNHGADTLTASILKTYTYQNQNKYQPAYRSYDDYLTEEVLGGLRYDDEVLGRIPEGITTQSHDADDVSRALIEQGAFVQSLAYQLQEDVADISLSLDDLIEKDPTITTNNAEVKQLLEQLDVAIKDFDTQSQPLYGKGGYIAEDLAYAKSCAMMYNTTIRQALSPNRQIQSYADEQYDYYDLVYKNYHDCSEVITLNANLSPSFYIMQSITKDDLDFLVQEKQCHLNKYRTIQSLLNSGKGHHNDAEAFAQAYIDNINCLDVALHDRYDEYQPSQMTTLHDAIRHSAEQYHHPESNTERSPLTQIKTAFDDYKRMKQEGLADQPVLSSKNYALGNLPPMLVGFLSMFLDNNKQTDGQISAKNLYVYDRNVVTVLSHHQPQARQITTVGSMDFYSPTMEYSIQLPIQLDFNQSKLKADVSAILPIIATRASKHMPSLSELPEREMTFALPNDLHKQLPMPVIFDAINQGILDTIKELDDENFTAVDISNDKFAKKIGATSAIKVHFDLHDLGNATGVVIKHISKALKAHVDANTADYTDGKSAKIKQAIDDLALINDGYHSQDLGNLMQLIESVLSMNLTQTNYFYLDHQGKIVGTQVIESLNESLENVRTKSIHQTRFSSKPFTHPLNDKLANSFNTNKEFDGTKWLIDTIEDAKLQKKAKQARQSYEYTQDGDYGVVEEMSQEAMDQFDK